VNECLHFQIRTVDHQQPPHRLGVRRFQSFGGLGRGVKIRFGFLVVNVIVYAYILSSSLEVNAYREIQTLARIEVRLVIV
jgi:hypothetical protein